MHTPTLVLEYPGIGGKRLEPQGPRLLGDAARKTHLFHLVDGDFASIDPAASHVRLTALGGPVTLRSVHFYSPAAARTEPSGRATGFTAEKQRSGEVHVRFRLDRQADLNLGVFNRGEVVAVLAGGIHPPGVHEYSWSVDKQGAGEYKVRLQVGFAGLQFLRKLESPPALLNTTKQSTDKKNNHPLSDPFGNTYHLLPSRTRALNFDVFYFVEMKDRQGNLVSEFAIPAKAKAVGPDPWYVLPGNRNWLSLGPEGNLLVSAADQTWPKDDPGDDPGYIFSKEELTLWEPRYAQVLVESLDLSDPPVARN